MFHPKALYPRYRDNNSQPPQFTMRGLWREVNEFFSSTSIHGFPYISDSQSRSTRIIWTVIVISGFAVTSYFLYNTVNGFNEKYVTTTVETRSIKEFPYPAVTFYPGEYNSKDAFLRDFLNQFEFTRYHKDSVLRDNEKFMQLYSWLIIPTKDQLLDDIENILIKDKKVISGGPFKGCTFLQYMTSSLKQEVCQLVALRENKNISLKPSIRDLFMSNMYKYRILMSPYSHPFVNEISRIIQESLNEQNLTKSEIETTCNDENKGSLQKVGIIPTV